jgi:predicted methyltransferase
MTLSDADRKASTIVARNRPAPLRAYDQIPMQTEDLARQVKLIAPLLASQRVAFVGDMDGTASLLGLLAAAGGPAPTHMLVLDFDARVLESALNLAERNGFAHLLKVQLYNCFDPIPSPLIAGFDWFYTNPPYGSHNDGESARLFLTRGCELARSEGGSGCLIVPNDELRPWTTRAMTATKQFLDSHGWAIQEQVDRVHRYYLDDDPTLKSSMFVLDRVLVEATPIMPYAGRQVSMDEIPLFYGRSTVLPYPSSIGLDGTLIGAEAA